MENEKWQDLISRKDLIKAAEAKKYAISDNTHPYEALRIQGKYFREVVDSAPAVDAVEVVRCKECRWAKPYERTDGKIGYYCHFCGHSFKYGTNWERLFTPIKESDDFCSYGERKDMGG